MPRKSVVKDFIARVFLRHSSRIHAPARLLARLRFSMQRSSARYLVVVVVVCRIAYAYPENAIRSASLPAGHADVTAVLRS